MATFGSRKRVALVSDHNFIFNQTFFYDCLLADCNNWLGRNIILEFAKQMDNDYSKVVRVKKSTKLKENIAIKIKLRGFERCARQNKKGCKKTLLYLRSERGSSADLSSHSPQVDILHLGGIKLRAHTAAVAAEFSGTKCLNNCKKQLFETSQKFVNLKENSEQKVINF